MVHVLYGINLISKEKMGAMSSYDPQGHYLFFDK